MLIGSHVSFKASQALASSVEEALSYEANTFMLYTGAPQNTRRSEMDQASIAAGKKMMVETRCTNLSFMHLISST